MPTKVATRSTITKTATTKRPAGKRPAARRVKSKSSTFERVLRENLHWIVLSAAAIVVGVLLFVGYQKVIASSIFEVRQIDILGTNHTDNKNIEETVRNLTGKTGVWNSDVVTIQKAIEKLSWIKTASVSRVLPDRLRIRVSEREPKAIVRLDSGAKVWVDDEARILGEVKSDENSSFVMTGWNEAKDGEATKKNQERVRLYLRILDEFRKAEIAARVAAIDLSVLQDIEATVNQNGVIKPVKLGNQDFAERLKPALTLLETLESNGALETVEKIIAYDRTPVVGYKTANAQNNLKVSQKMASKTVR
ncbi:MAG: FtsQ-type POTRA domain-containing protein [Pyrinomonadaceae bacterium]